MDIMKSLFDEEYNRKMHEKSIIKEERMACAKSLLTDGISVELVAKYSRLSIEEVKKLKSEIN